eukprot:6679849-Prymnesium_polylepis.1
MVSSPPSTRTERLSARVRRLRCTGGAPLQMMSSALLPGAGSSDDPSSPSIQISEAWALALITSGPVNE